MTSRKSRIEVTAENFGDLLVEGLEEAVAVEEGRLEPARVTRHKITAREARVTPPPLYGSKSIVEVRRSLGVSQPVFAEMLNVSRSTVRAWEQGTRTPEGATLRLLQVAEHHPEVLVRAVGRKKSA